MESPTSGLQGGMNTTDSTDGVVASPFPAATKQVSGLVSGLHTDITSLYFADRILITVSQAGRLAQWVQVPLSPASPTSLDTALPHGDTDMLPLGHLTPSVLLGAGGEQRETIGRLYATQIASAIVKKNPEETRTLLVGFGLEKAGMDREAFFDLMELVHEAL